MRYFKMILVLTLFVLNYSCDKNSTKPTPTEQNENTPSKNTITFPFTENFDEKAKDIYLNWNFYHHGLSNYTPAAASLDFELDSTTSVSSPACMSAVEYNGMRYGGFNGYVYYGGALEFKKMINLSTKNSCTLTFQNKRNIVESTSLPSGDSGNSDCYVRVSADSGNTWSTAKIFSTDKSRWSLETVSLNMLAGSHNAKLVFLIPSHASYAEHSTSWHIDDITITSN